MLSALLRTIRSFSWKEWTLVILVVAVFAAMFGTIGLTMGPLVAYLMTLGLRRTRSNRSAGARFVR